MALKEIRKEIAYPNDLPIRPWPFALISFYGLVTQVKEGHMALKEIRKEIVYHSN